MAWLLFEVLLAFGVALFIVWWTFPKKTPRADGDNKAAEQDSAGSKGGEGQ